MSDSTRSADLTGESLSGTARLWAAVPVAMATFFYTNILDYCLPLYFSALELPPDTWSNLVKWKLAGWIAGPAVAGLLCRRYGERWVWSGSLLGKVIVILGLIYFPTPLAIQLLSLWQGFTGALMWIAGVSLIQMVPARRKGLSNGLVMVSVGVGAVFGALVGRYIIYLKELNPFLSQGDLGGVCSRLFNFTPMTSIPQIEDFYIIFWMLMLTTTFSATVIVLFGQRPGQFHQEQPANWGRAFQDVGQLLRNPTFWALVIPLALLGGPVFQASNQFLPYRAEDLGLKQGSEDLGWIWLKLLQTIMWIPGGVAVGMLAGRRAPGLAAVAMLGAFSLAAAGIGFSAVTWQLFVSVAFFEFARQFMRWSHAGYMSEHMPDSLRATAIGCTITFSGLGSTIYSWVAPIIWNPQSDDFQSWAPVVAAAVLGLTGTVGLFLYDRIWPIRGGKVQDVQEDAGGV